MIYNEDYNCIASSLDMIYDVLYYLGSGFV